MAEQFPNTDPEPTRQQDQADDGLDSMTVDELRDEATRRGVSVPSDAKKSDILARLRGQAQGA